MLLILRKAEKQLAVGSWQLRKNKIGDNRPFEHQKASKTVSVYDPNVSKASERS
jgi:hypothetical protein